MKHPLRESARGQGCTVHLTACNRNPETVVLAHAPSLDKGWAVKGPDWWAAYACSSCHDLLDGRAPWEECCTKIEAWWWAVYRTQKIMHQEGLLT